MISLTNLNQAPSPVTVKQTSAPGWSRTRNEDVFHSYDKEEKLVMFNLIESNSWLRKCGISESVCQFQVSYFVSL